MRSYIDHFYCKKIHTYNICINETLDWRRVWCLTRVSVWYWRNTETRGYIQIFSFFKLWLLLMCQLVVSGVHVCISAWYVKAIFISLISLLFCRYWVPWVAWYTTRGKKAIPWWHFHCDNILGGKNMAFIIVNVSMCVTTTNQNDTDWKFWELPFFSFFYFCYPILPFFVFFVKYTKDSKIRHIQIYLENCNMREDQFCLDSSSIFCFFFN